LAPWDFGEFCRKAQLYDKKFTRTEADRIFIAANYDPHANELEHNAGSAELIRYEFMEALVRIVKLKYIDPGIYTKYYDALKYLLEEKASQVP